MINRLRKAILGDLLPQLSFDHISVEQLKRVASNFGYELKRIRRWTDPYDFHSATKAEGNGDFSVVEMPDMRWERDDQKRIAKLLKAIPKSGSLRKYSYRTTTDSSERFMSHVRPASIRPQ